MVPLLSQFFEIGIAIFFEDVEFRGRNKVKDIVFEEESVSIPITVYRLLYMSLFEKQIWNLIKTMLNNISLKLR